MQVQNFVESFCVLILIKPNTRKWAYTDSSTLTYSITRHRMGKGGYFVAQGDIPWFFKILFWVFVKSQSGCSGVLWCSQILHHRNFFLVPVYFSVACPSFEVLSFKIVTAQNIYVIVTHWSILWFVCGDALSGKSVCVCVCLIISWINVIGRLIWSVNGSVCLCVLCVFYSPFFNFFFIEIQPAKY